MTNRIILAAGYGLAIPLTLVVRRIIRRRWLGAFLALEAGTGLLVAGWLRSRQPVPAVLNATAMFGFASWYLLGRKPARALLMLRLWCWSRLRWCIPKPTAPPSPGPRSR